MNLFLMIRNSRFSNRSSLASENDLSHCSFLFNKRLSVILAVMRLSALYFIHNWGTPWILSKSDLYIRQSSTTVTCYRPAFVMPYGTFLSFHTKPHLLCVSHRRRMDISCLELATLKVRLLLFILVMLCAVFAAVETRKQIPSNWAFSVPFWTFPFSRSLFSWGVVSPLSGFYLAQF